MRPISSHLDRASLTNKRFIIWLSGKFFLWDMAGSPKLHLARSGSQSQCRICLILPARGARQKIKCNFAEYEKRYDEIQVLLKRCEMVGKYYLFVWHCTIQYMDFKY